MSRFVTLALAAVSVLALSAGAAPEADLTAGVATSSRVGNWCC